MPYNLLYPPYNPSNTPSSPSSSWSQSSNTACILVRLEVKWLSAVGRAWARGMPCSCGLIIWLRYVCAHILTYVHICTDTRTQTHTHTHTHTCMLMRTHTRTSSSTLLSFLSISYLFFCPFSPNTVFLSICLCASYVIIQELQEAPGRMVESRCISGGIDHGFISWLAYGSTLTPFMRVKVLQLQVAISSCVSSVSLPLLRIFFSFQILSFYSKCFVLLFFRSSIDWYFNVNNYEFVC